MTRPKPRAPAPLESEVTSAVLAAAAIYGIELKRQNSGLAFNPKGRPVRFGEPGACDWTGTVPAGPSRGRAVSVEIKRGDFVPTKLKGEKAEHFARQVAVMKRLNDAGGFAFWCRDGADAAEVFRRLVTLPGLRVEIDERGFCWTDDGRP